MAQNVDVSLIVVAMAACLIVGTSANGFCNSHHLPLEKHGFNLLRWHNAQPTAKDETVNVDLWIDPTCPDGKAAWHQVLKVKTHLQSNDAVLTTLPAHVNLRVHLFPLGFHPQSWKWLEAFTCIRDRAPQQLEAFVTAMYEDYYKSLDLTKWVLERKLMTSSLAGCVQHGVDIRTEYKRGLSAGVYDSPTIFFNDEVSLREFSWTSWLESITKAAKDDFDKA
eukprot:TRINITY_DN12069_c1_g11_i1.p1 TRINITY_DN12069_c1_g11~~TRINITY_DN12069_c1_g11_i1.p1  ORF type:complete len:222 (+),score=41.53 TRINITY_DN12069_c1_g11_i1:136-801(+)